MIIMRLRYRKLGGHYHCRLFTAPGIDQNFAKCGDLVFDEREWTEVRVIFECGGAEVLEDPPQVSITYWSHGLKMGRLRW